MAQTAVDVVVRVKDLAALDRLKKSLAGVDGATFKASQGINKFENSIKRLQGVLGGLAVGDQLRRAFGAAADFSATTQRLGNLTKQYAQLAGIQELAAASAEKFGISTAQASADLADLGSRLGSSGANLKDLSDIYEGFNTLLAVNAVNSQQAASAQLQLNQALGSGRLAGEEFNAINEATPQLLDEVAKVLGVARGELKQLASDGEISSQVLIEALRNVAESGGDALADFFKTPAGQLKLFDKAIQDFQVTVGQQLLPVFTPIVEALSTLLQLFGQLPGPVKATAVAVTALGAAFAILGGPITAIAAGIIGITLVIKKLADENEAFAAALQGAWNNILAGLEGVSAFFQAFFANISQQAGEFLAYWQGIGNLIAETWNAGIANITEAFGRWQGYFNEVVQAIANAWNQLMGLIPDAFFKAVSALGQIFSPFVDFLNQAFGAISNAWNSLLESMGLNWGTLINEMIAAVLPLTRVFKAMGVDIGESISAGVSAGFKAFSSFQPGEAPSLNLPGVSGLTGVTPPSGGSGGGGGKKGGKGGAGSAERELELQQQQLKAAQDLLFASENRLKVLEGITEAEKLKIESSVKKLEIERQYEELLQNSKSAEETLTLQLAQKNELKANELELEKSLQELRDGALSSIKEEIAELEAKLAGKEEEYKLQKKINDLVAAGGGEISEEEAAAQVKRLEGLKAQVAEMEKTKELVNQISGTIASEFTNAISSVIQGTKSVDEAFSDMLGNIGKAFVDMALEIIQQQMVLIANALIMKALGVSMPGAGSGAFGSGASAPISNIPFSAGGIGYRADGGPVIGGKPYIVGEDGQELFIPGFSGTVVPNDVFEATKEALIEDGEVIATDDSEAETASALSANNSSISTTYNNTTTDSADAETAKALERNSEIINNTLRNSEVQSALTENNKSIKNINYGDSTSVNEAFAVNNNSIQSQRLAAATTTERETMQQLMNSSSKMTVSYESTVINQQEYVTAEQHQKGVTQAAMKGRDMALASLKNSVRARKGIGLS